MSKRELNCEWTIGQVLDRYPETAAVFKRFGLDGLASDTKVHDAAHRDGVTPEVLCRELHGFGLQCGAA